MIDPALLRPGRIDIKVYCPIPDEVMAATFAVKNITIFSLADVQADRLEILKCHTSSLVLSPSADAHLEVLAKGTEGFTGADLRALCSNARLAAVKENIAIKGMVLVQSVLPVVVWMVNV